MGTDKADILVVEQVFFLAVPLTLAIPTKYTRARENRLPRADVSCLLEISLPRARVYLARPTIALAKIRDYSQKAGS